MTFSQNEREAVAAICLMAAFADGNKDATERDRLKEIFSSLESEFSPSLYTNVLMGKTTLEGAAESLRTPTARLLAYEMAVGVCDADGQQDAKEQEFLHKLQVALDLDPHLAEDISKDGDELASMPLSQEIPEDTFEPSMASTHVQAESSVLREDPSVDPLILKFAILNGGLELLPQSLASMAIVPLQMKMVYQIGAKYGYQLDQGHIKDFLAVVGVGMTSQVLEKYARKLVGGFVKKAVGKKKKKKGKKFAKAAGAATGMAMSFATTYALGHVARVYYARGRELTPDALKRLFSERVEQGKSLVDTYRPQIESSARSTDINSLLSMVRNPVG